MPPAYFFISFCQLMDLKSMFYTNLQYTRVSEKVPTSSTSLCTSTATRVSVHSTVTVWEVSNSCLDGLESQGHGFYQSYGDRSAGLESLYDDQFLDEFLDYLRREYQADRDNLSSVGGEKYSSIALVD